MNKTTCTDEISLAPLVGDGLDDAGAVRAAGGGDALQVPRRDPRQQRLGHARLHVSPHHELPCSTPTPNRAQVNGSRLKPPLTSEGSTNSGNCRFTVEARTDSEQQQRKIAHIFRIWTGQIITENS